MKINTGLWILGLISSLLLISGCMSTMIEDVKSKDNIGKKVTVFGTVQNTIKLGELSGYTLEDETATIAVSSESLPKEGTEIRVTGILVKDTLLGYYIQVD
jgi:aspartyl/asparaginyl-tRNA synthetase